MASVVTISVIVSIVSVVSVVSAFTLWQKWTNENRAYAVSETGRLVHEMLWQMMISWTHEIAATREYREVTSEFITKIHALATVELGEHDGGDFTRDIDEGLRRG